MMLIKKPTAKNSGPSDVGHLVATLFLSREIAHREHLFTDSFSVHKSLEEFYNAIVEIADTITEAYQGRCGEPINIPILSEEGKGSIKDRLQNHLASIEAMRYTALDKEDTAIQNLVDEAVKEYLTINDKLRRT
jgi:hypothetical protein